MGTSLAVDPDRAKQREQFQALHEEAKSRPGEGREAMLNRIQGRWQQFGGAQTSRLQEIADRRESLAAEYSGLRDSDEEERFQQYKDYTARKGKKSRQFKKLIDEGIPEEFLREIEEQYYREIPGAKRIKKGSLVYEESLDGGGKSKKKKIERARQKKLGDYARRAWEAKYGGDREENYLQRISDEVDRINKHYIPLQEEEAGRHARLADRAELYNMFLGE
jgi:hypothetical protein